MTFAISTMSLRIRYTTTKGSGGRGSSRVPSTRPVLPLFGRNFNEPALSYIDCLGNALSGSLIFLPDVFYNSREGFSSGRQPAPLHLLAELLSDTGAGFL